LRTVADITATTPWRLQQIPGVGPQTAAQALAAANQLAHAIEADIAVRLDPDHQDPIQTELLAALWALDQAERLTSPLHQPIAHLDASLASLLERAVPATSRMRMAFSRKRSRIAALDAVAELQAFLKRTEIAGLSADVQRITNILASPLRNPVELWRDYQSRAAAYYALLGELGDLDLDVEAAQGFVPAEIAARVNEQQLDDAFLRVSLRGYQAFGAKFALVQRRAMLGDEMGLGKTIEAITALAHLRSMGATHFMAVCPASVLVNWTREIRAHSELRPYRVHGGDRDANLRGWAKHGGVAVTTFDSLRALAPPDDVDVAMLVVDEAHYVKNAAAQRSQAVSRWVDEADRVLFLTGTPMENRVEEFKNLIAYLQPDATNSISRLSGVAGPTAFRKGVAPVYLRRNQADVLAELPERLEMEDWVEFGTDDSRAYRDAVASRNFMAMRRAAYAPGSPWRSAKLARLVEIVDESAANEWKTVVFSYFRDVLETVQTILGPSALGPLTGSIAPTARQDLVDEFTSFDGHAVLVSQIQAGGVGLNMQAASVVILTEPQWKPTIEEQAIARCHRMGQVRRVHVHRLLAQDSVDQRMLEILQTKALLFDEYVRQSELKEASPDAIDISQVEEARRVVSESEAERKIVESERKIVESERERLGLEA
jgi:SNF2 family DNA or RNA helicase